MHPSTPHAHTHPATRSSVRHPNDRHPMVTINGVPPSVVHVGATAIAAGNTHSMVMKQDGTVWTTGYGEKGQLGDGTLTRTVLTFKKVVSSGQCDSKGMFTGVCVKPCVRAS